MNRTKYFISPIVIALLLTGCVNRKPPYPTPNEINIALDDVNLTDFDIHTDWQKEFLNTADKDTLISDTATMGNFSNSKPNPITISWEESNDKGVSPTKQVLAVSENGQFDDASKTMRINLGTEIKEYDLYNFKLNTTYQYRIENMYDKKAFNSEAKSFTVTGSTPRNYYVEGVENVRDLGGYNIGADKAYKQGMLYRCGRLNYLVKTEITELGKSQFINELHVKTEIDLRKTSSSVFAYGENGDITSSPAGNSVRYVSCPMDYSSSNIFTNDNNKPAIKTFFETLAEPSNYPVAFHCSIGTDRTGALAYALGALMGVSEQNLMTDYLFSNLAKIGGKRYSTTISGDSFYVQGINNSTGATLSEKAENYLIANVGVSKTTLDSIRMILVENK